MPFDFGPENNTEGDFQVVNEFLVENSTEYPILMERAQAMKSILSEACPECTQTQGVIALLICFDGKIDDVTRAKLSIDGRAMADDWNNSMEAIRKDRRMFGSSAEVKQLHLALHIIRMQEYLETEVKNNTQEEYNTVTNMKHGADFVLKHVGNAGSEELLGMYKMYSEKIGYRVTDAMMRLQGREPPNFTM
jgi:hypothetical protein